MKSIEIHIEGYKIVITEEKQAEVSKDEKKTTAPFPICPTNPYVDKYPYVTWTGGEMTTTNTIGTEKFTPIRDVMTGKVTDEDA